MSGRRQGSGFHDHRATHVLLEECRGRSHLLGNLGHVRTTSMAAEIRLEKVSKSEFCVYSGLLFSSSLSPPSSSPLFASRTLYHLVRNSFSGCLMRRFWKAFSGPAATYSDYFPILFYGQEYQLSACTIFSPLNTQ